MTTSVNGTTAEAIRKLSGYRELDTTVFPWMGVYGDNGTGKTYLCASASMVPEMCPVVLISIGRPDYTLEHKSDIEPKEITLIDPRVYAREKHIGNLWDASKQVIRSVANMNPFPFKTVILDDLSLLQSFAEDQAAAVSPFHQGPSVLLELPQQGDYRLAKSRILDALIRLQDVCVENKATFMWTAQARMTHVVPEGEPVLDEKGAEVKMYRATPGVMPSMIQEIQGLVTIVGKCRISSTTHVLETRRSQYRDAKDPTGTLQDQMRSPTAAKIRNLHIKN